MMGREREHVFLMSPVTSRQNTWAVKGTVAMLDSLIVFCPRREASVAVTTRVGTLYSSEGDCYTEEMNQMMIFIGSHE
jgi:hypothetical protein